ncbi:MULTISPECIES: hypothetical protein [Larsenimonas]|uniref:DUF3862 domain-containing protein n=1 Tax=Larsenimonas suaedae TaxID=1851019 RepID=A0ABU1GYE8_9GAMM|nr:MULTISPECIES: hypothetical protein [Larsenimonas]MCM2973559.1 hypothetical protein [Larsenimonas suaedae]MCM5705270.1 hypothetical protein [Larsenimonas salina]MDR5897071.1 hypothetical protein [Larsenimonas suaedae]
MKRHCRSSLAVIALAALTLVGVSGCMESQLSMTNYDQLKTGMSRGDVEAVLGKASECSGAVGVANCRWGDDRRFIQAQFVGGHAVSYQYQGLE